MKKTIAIICALFVLAVAMCNTAQAGSLDNNLRGFYAQTFIVVQVDPDGNLVTIETAKGNQFDFYGADGWQEGDICSCIMYDRSTTQATDDMIVTTEHSGRLEMFM